jgi:parvulin-like peptidyl-prolyl isomerase
MRWFPPKADRLAQATGKRQEFLMTKRKKTRSSASLTKKQMSRRRREERYLRWIWIGVGAIAALVVVLLATGLILQSTQSVAVVNDEPIRVGEYQKRLRFWTSYYDFLAPGSFDNLQAEQRTSFYREIADQLIEEELVRQEANKQGVSVGDDEIQVEIEETWFQHYRTPPTPTPSPTPDPQRTPTAPGTPLPSPTPDTEEAFQTRYQQFVDEVLKPAQLNETYFRQLVEASLLREELQLALVPDVPEQEDQVRFRYLNARDGEDASAKIAAIQSGASEQVHARHILVETSEQAQDILDRLQAGEDFIALAAEFSTDESNKDEGGDLGWFGRGQMVAEFEQAAFEGEIGLYPTPIETQFGYHVLEILDRETRPYDPEEEMIDAGWYGKPALSERFGPLFAEILFDSEVGLLTEPVPTQFGVAVVELLEHTLRELNQAEQDSKRAQIFEQRLSEIREEADIQDLWDESMIPRDL